MIALDDLARTWPDLAWSREGEAHVGRTRGHALHVGRDYVIVVLRGVPSTHRHGGSIASLVDVVVAALEVGPLRPRRATSPTRYPRGTEFDPEATATALSSDVLACSVCGRPVDVCARDRRACTP